MAHDGEIAGIISDNGQIVHDETIISKFYLMEESYVLRPNLTSPENQIIYL